MKIGNPHEFTACMREYFPHADMSLLEAIAYLENESECGWSIRYYGFGEHLTFWPGDGTFVDFGIDQDTKIDFEMLKRIIILSAVARKEFNKNLNKLIGEK